MSNYQLLPLLVSLLVLPRNASPFPWNASKPPFFVLAGDSTTASQSANGGGWGDGFLNTTLYHGASGKNYGANGATTVSFREAHWDRVLSTASQHRENYTPFVTIQFGHNDQKPSANISINEFTANLEKMATETRDAGAIPIQVTPLSRRSYDNSTGSPVIIENLADWRAAAIHAANNVRSAYIGLNMYSTEYLNSIGPERAHTYNLKPDDNTHLNMEGSQVFGGLVAMLILRDFPWLEHFVRVDWQLREAIEHGQYYWP